MSLYEMLPQKQPQPENLPDNGGSRNDDGWLDPFSLLAEEVLELAGELTVDEPQHALAGDAAAPGAEPPPDAGDENGLQAYIRAAFERKLPQITEYRQKGYNLRGPDEGAVKKLQATMERTSREPGAGVLLEPARRFLAVLQTLPDDPAMPPVLQETVLQASRLVQLLSTALEALTAGAKTGQLDWQAEAKRHARQQRAKLVAALPDADRAQQLHAEGLMFSETYRLGAEFKQFARLQDSLMAESRIVRHRLTGWLEENTTRIEEGARDIRESAINTLLAQATAKPSGTPEQLAAWGARFQEFARSLPGRDSEFDSGRLAGNPLAAAFSSVMNASADEPAHVRLARAMLPVTAALGHASALLVRAQRRVALPETETNKVVVKPKLSLPEKARLAGRGVLTGTATLARKAGHRTSRGAFRTGHLARHLLRLTSDPEGLDRAVRNTGLLLLDEIQQTERQLGQLATQAWLLQEATEQQWRVQAETASLAPAMPELSALLAAELQKESARWQLTAQQAVTVLETLLAPFVRLSEAGFYSELSDELQQAKALSEQKRFGDIAGMAGTMSGVAEGLGGIARGLDSAVIRLSEHGHAGGQELNTLLGTYRRQLSQLKAQVKTRVTGITGSSLASFSRGGMLARGVAEWAEALKQAWLAGLAPAQRADAATQFDQALMAVMEENRAHFAGSHDPQAEGFLKRLTLARRHAAAGTQIYPPTAEEILAGSRSVPEDLRRWAERRVLGGALWAVLRGGFNLVTGPVSLPLRVAIRGARTGYTLAGGLRQMNRVRLGAGPATEVKRQFINQELAKIGIRLALSLSPVTGWSVAVTITAAETWKIRDDTKALKKRVKKFALNIPEEGLWIGGYAGLSAGVNASVQAWTAHRMRQEIDDIVAELLAPGASPEVSSFDDVVDEYDSDEEETSEPERSDDEAEYDFGPAIRSDKQIENDAGEITLTGAFTAPAQENPGAKPRRIAPSGRSGLISSAGRATKAAALAPISQAAPGLEPTDEEKQQTEAIPVVSVSQVEPEAEPTDEEEETIPRRRGKRAAETDKLTPSNYYYPAPNRETAIDIDLEVRVLQLFPVKHSFRIPADQAVLSAPRQKVYHYDNSDYLYIGGRYRYIKMVYQSEDGGWEAKVYPYARPEDDQNQPIKIRFNTIDDKWYLDEGEENKEIKPDPSVVTTTYFLNIRKEDTESAKLISAEKAYTYAQMLPGTEGQIYDDGTKKYIFLGGRYWDVEFPSSHTFRVPVMDEKFKMKYSFTVNDLSPQEKPATPKSKPFYHVQFKISPIVELALKSIRPGTGYPFKNPSPGIEGAYYIREGNHYFFLLGKYWPVRVYSNATIEVTIRTEKKGGSVKFILILEDDVLKFKSGRGAGDNIMQSSLSPAVSDELKSADASSQFTHPNVKTALAGFIYKYEKDNYIFVNGAFYNFQWISENLGAIKFTVSGVDRLVFIKQSQQQWEFLEKTTSENYASFDDTLRRIKFIDADSGIHKKLQSLLTESGYESWQTILVNLRDVLDEEIFNRYTNPNDPLLKNLMIIKSRVSSWISTDNDKDKPASTVPERAWNEPLLDLYRTALTQGTPNPGILTAAQSARAQIKDLKNKKDSLTTESIEKRINEQHAIIASEKSELAKLDQQFSESSIPYETAKRNAEYVRHHERLINAAKERIKTMEEVRDAITAKIKEYDQQIQALNKVYRLAFAGIASGEEALKTNLAQQGAEKDESIATEAAIVELALKELAITSKVRSAYTPEELNELKKIGIAKSLLLFKQAKEATYDEIVSQLKDSDIDKPALKNSYLDIIWADEQGAKITQKIFSTATNGEVNNMMSAILYWLLKNNSNVASLKKTKVDTILDNYYSDVQALNPLTKVKEMPKGYTPLSGMLESKYFYSQTEYNDQFINYKNNYSEYEASQSVRDILLASPLTLKTLLQPIKKRFRLKLTTGLKVNETYSGEMLFIQLEDDSWVFFSLFPGKVFTKTFTNAEMHRSKYLREIANLEPKKTFTSSGMGEVYNHDFFKKYFSNANKKPYPYDEPGEQWPHVLSNLIKWDLYRGKGYVYDSPPVKDDHKEVHRVVYSYDDNGAVEAGTNVIDAVNQSMTGVLRHSADARKKALYKPSIAQIITGIIIPFYNEIYQSVTDKEYSADPDSIFLDTLGIISTLTSAGVKVATIARNSRNVAAITHEGMKKGLTGVSLQKFVAKRLAASAEFAPLRYAKITTSALVDMVDPFMVKNVANYALKSTRSVISKLSNILPSANISAARGSINSPQRAVGVNLDAMRKETVHGGEVYTSQPPGSADKTYYIKVGAEGIYEVRWDEAYGVWRTVDPEHPDILSYGQRLIYVNDQWYLNTFRTRGPSKNKPKLNIEDFRVNGEIDMAAYLAEKGRLSKMKMDEIPEFSDNAIRREAALKELAKQKPTEIAKVVVNNENPSFSLTSMPEKPAKTLYLNSHGWFTELTPEYRIPPSKELVFLGPHGKTLAEAPGDIPSVTLLAGNSAPIHYARFKRGPGIKDYGEKYTLANAGTTRENYVRDYSIKYYEKTPQEELTLAVLLNRQKKDSEAIDILSVNPLAENSKKLSDVMKQMDKYGDYSQYDKLVFVACREDKSKGVVSYGLGGSYQIQFSDSETVLESLPSTSAATRSASDVGSAAASTGAVASPGAVSPTIAGAATTAATGAVIGGAATAVSGIAEADKGVETEAAKEVKFDGSLIYEKVTINRLTDEITTELIGIIPYLDPHKDADTSGDKDAEDKVAETKP